MKYKLGSKVQNVSETASEILIKDIENDSDIDYSQCRKWQKSTRLHGQWNENTS